MILPFALLELLALAAAFVMVVRHAADGETIVLQDGRLVVELELAGKLERLEFHSRWVRVEPESGRQSLIRVSGEGKTVSVGRYVRPELRPLLAREIRMALSAQ